MKKTTLKFLTVISIILLLLSSCSSKGLMNNAVGDAGVRGDIYSPTDNELLKEEASSGTQSGNIGESNLSNRKIIETIELSVQTKEFDLLIKNIEEEIITLGGYIESSNVSGREFDSDKNRSAHFKVRIPSDSSGNFTEFVSDNSTVTNKNITTKDVTLSYVDMESRVNALEAEKEALEKLLSEAKNMTDVINIRDKLTDVIYEIESYKSQLRTYDNLVDYSTITIYIHEVERTLVVEEQTTWQKIGTNLKNNFENVWDGTVALFVLIVSSIPYLIPLAIISVIVIIIVSVNKKRKAKNKQSNNTSN